jgi:hypothetical protein
VALHAHLPRQQWVEEVITRHLSASPAQLATDGAFGHPDSIPHQGTVPTLPEWQYRFHGCGCCLTHADGTCIDVDIDPEHEASAIDPYFYSAYLESLPSPTGVEALLRRPEPFSTCWHADLDGLREQGLIAGEHRVHLTESGLQVASTIREAMNAAPSLDAWAAPGEVATAARNAKLLVRLERRRDSAGLMALASLGRAAAEPCVSRILSEPTIDRLTATAVELVGSWKDAVHDARLLGLASRCTPQSPPETYLRSQVIELIIRRYRADTLSATLRGQLQELLSVEGHGAEAAYARHLYLLEPQAGLERLARALHHDIPIVRSEAAAALVVIGAPESAALLSSSGTAEAKTALELLRGLDPEPGPAPVGEEIMWRGQPKRVYSGAEVEAASVHLWVVSETEELTRSFLPTMQRWWSQ